LFSLSNQRGAKSTDTARNTQGLRLLFLLHLARFAHCFFRSSLPLFGPRIRALFQLVFLCSKQRGAKSTDAAQRAQALSANFFRAREFLRVRRACWTRYPCACTWPAAAAFRRRSTRAKRSIVT
jgi:hypothetical protein